MVERLWVPLTHSLRARNWKRAASGACLTASRVANRVAVSTPLRTGLPASAAVMSVVVMVVSLLGLSCCLVVVVLGRGRFTEYEPAASFPRRPWRVRRWRAAAGPGGAGPPAPQPPLRWRR